MSQPSVRPLRDGDLDVLSRSLNGWFADYDDHLDYTAPVLGFLHRTVLRPHDVSVVAEADGEIVGAFLAGARPASFQGEAVRVSHLAAAAVAPSHRGQGLGTALGRAMEDRAVASGVDVMGLMTQEAHGAQALYDRLGYRLVERFQPPGARIGGVMSIPGVEEVDPGAFFDRAPPLTPRPGALAEHPRDATGLGGERLPRMRCFVGGEAGVALILWPVLAQAVAEGPLVPMRSAELARTFGGGVQLDAVLAHALHQARHDEAVGVYQLPGTGPTATGLAGEGAAWTLRMAKGVSDRGRGVAEAMTAWDPVPPGP